MPFASLSTTRPKRACLFAIAALAAIALSGCATQTATPVGPQAPAVAPGTQPGHPLTENKPTFLNLPNIPTDHTPVRVGVILPFNSGTPAVKALAAAMLKSAQLAMYDSGNKDMIIMTADEGATAESAAAAAVHLLEQGAEIIVGPLYAQSVRAIAAETRDRGVPVLSFSTDRSVAGDGIYLLGFLPEAETDRVVSYAIAHGHHKIAALVPSTAYGDVTLGALRDTVKADNGEVGDVVRFPATVDGIIAPATQAAHPGDADALFLPQGGAILRAGAPALGTAGLNKDKVKLLGTGQWNEAANSEAPTLYGAWFAAPDPKDDARFADKYRGAFGSNPPPLAGLAYDAVSLVAKLAEKGEPYKRFTRQALADPNGFAGVDGIFRFSSDGTAERGLAILSVGADGFHVEDPAPTTFVKPGS
ncbi:MAG: penicillin-binding protein activator [Alphaproteobacteria bacterium]|nr:penicillin-binding protein activator [Alphaproteobacteria bacterium]MBL7099560.1 penicillin-binding protein activator [Alphaproteobacteria bacterium]